MQLSPIWFFDPPPALCLWSGSGPDWSGLVRRFPAVAGRFGSHRLDDHRFGRLGFGTIRPFIIADRSILFVSRTFVYVWTFRSGT